MSDPTHPPRRTGQLIAFEGGEACGKSTQARRLAERIGAVLTREPGATAVGTALRSILLDPATRMSDRTEALLMAADRAQHVAEVIRPALEVGKHVVTDRYIGSSLAYQGFGRGLPLEQVRQLSSWATQGLDANVVVLLDVPADVAAARLTGRPDRLESAGDEFHRRVMDGFYALADADPAHWVAVDGTPDPDEVATAVWKAVSDRLPSLR